MPIDYEFLNSFCLEVIGADRSLRWAGVVNKNGVILAQQTRQGLQLLLSDEENEDYAAATIARQKTRSKFEGKIGRIIYAFGRYERVHRATIPVDGDHFLLVTIDVENLEFDKVIMDHLVPLIEKNRSKFRVRDDSI